MPVLASARAAAMVAILATPAGAQPTHEHGSARDPRLALGAQAIGLVTRVSPALFGRTMTEGYLTQPMVMARARTRGGLVSALVTLDFEGATLERGELTP